MSQGHNTLPQPGLEPGSSDSEPSALTTGLLNKTLELACPWYSWPCMFKVAPCTVVQSYGRTVVHPNFFGLMGYYYFVQLWSFALRAPLLDCDSFLVTTEIFIEQWYNILLFNQSPFKKCASQLQYTQKTRNVFAPIYIPAIIHVDLVQVADTLTKSIKILNKNEP